MGDRRELPGKYAAALYAYLWESTELTLTRAHELGRQALTDGLGVLDVASIHSGVLTDALAGPLRAEDPAPILEAAGRFFIEMLAPFEMAHRGFWEINIAIDRLDQTLEAQARRIASALHDEAAQLLASVHLALAELARKVPPDRGREIQAVRGLLDQIEARLRHLAYELRPPILDDRGLVPALEFLADRVSRRWGVSVTIDAATRGRIPADIETSLYRIAQEALTNVGRHANATRVDVSIRQTARQIVCSIRDDGIGLTATARQPYAQTRGLGLREIEERVVGLGGILRFGANVPSGTDLTVEIPLER